MEPARANTDEALSNYQGGFRAAQDWNQPGTTLEPALSLKEAVEFYKISEKTIRLHIGQGKIDARKEQGPRGLEWRIYPGGFPCEPDTVEAVVEQDDDHYQTGTTLEPGQNQPGTSPEPDWNHPGNEHPSSTTAKAVELDKLLEIIQVQGQNLQEANKKLESANYRIGYLEAQTQNYQEQVKLLTDSQHKPGWWGRFCSWFVGRQQTSS